jgi:hypothetical protein
MLGRLGEGLIAPVGDAPPGVGWTRRATGWRGAWGVPRLTLRNLGRLAEATIDLDKDLILLTGPNNTSKTYVAHAIYGFCKHYNESFPQEVIRALDGFVSGRGDGDRLSVDLIQFLDTCLSDLLESLGSSYRRELTNVFAATQDFTARTEIGLVIDQREREERKREIREQSVPCREQPAPALGLKEASSLQGKRREREKNHREAGRWGGER